MNVIGNHKLSIPKNGIQVTPAAGALATPGFALSAAVAGTATVTTGAGVSLVIGLPVGVQVYIEHTHVTAATATGIVSFN